MIRMMKSQKKWPAEFTRTNDSVPLENGAAENLTKNYDEMAVVIQCAQIHTMPQCKECRILRHNKTKCILRLIRKYESGKKSRQRAYSMCVMCVTSKFWMVLHKLLCEH